MFCCCYYIVVLQTCLYKKKPTGIRGFMILNLRTIHPLDDLLRQTNISPRQLQPLVAVSPSPTYAYHGRSTTRYMIKQNNKLNRTPNQPFRHIYVKMILQIAFKNNFFTFSYRLLLATLLKLIADKALKQYCSF